MAGPKRKHVDVAPELFRQLTYFRRMAEATLGENTPTTEVNDLVIQRGLDSLLRDLFGQPEMQDLALKTLIAMAHDNPEFVYAFIARAADIGGGMEEWWRNVKAPPNESNQTPPES